MVLRQQGEEPDQRRGDHDHLDGQRQRRVSLIALALAAAGVDELRDAEDDRHGHAREQTHDVDVHAQQLHLRFLGDKAGGEHQVVVREGGERQAVQDQQRQAAEHQLAG
ncbi:hypothetical protein SDC9_163107 [bioreactor metagenome]|uniref:Uncharacterized protein n=1 Tax=bioreactor metagenome TaxID=1076179 RepID=A0A645FMZ1_9ZZZZ